MNLLPLLRIECGLLGFETDELKTIRYDLFVETETVRNEIIKSLKYVFWESSKNLLLSTIIDCCCCLFFRRKKLSKKSGNSEAFFNLYIMQTCKISNVLLSHGTKASTATYQHLYNDFKRLMDLLEKNVRPLKKSKNAPQHQ